MSVLPQFTDFLEQPKVPPRFELPSRFSGQVVEQPMPMPSAQTPSLKFSESQTVEEQRSTDFSLTEQGTRFRLECCALVPALDKEIGLLGHPRPVEHPHALQAAQQDGRHLALGDPALDELEWAYVFNNRSAVSAFVQRNRIREFLLEAREPLNAAFGEAAVKSLTLVEDDEGFTTMFCLILFAGDILTAKLALQAFDEGWWLVRSAQVGGKLNFDFELI